MGYRLLEDNIHVLNVTKPGDPRVFKLNIKNIVIYKDEDFIKLLHLLNTNKNTDYVVNEGIRLFSNIKSKYSDYLIYDDILALDSNQGYKTINTILKNSTIKPSKSYLERKIDFPNDSLFTVEPYTEHEKYEFNLEGLINLIKITFINYEHKQAVLKYDRDKILIQNFTGGDYNDRSTQRIFLDNRVEAEIVTNYGYGQISYLICSFYLDGEKIKEYDRKIFYQNGREPKIIEYTKDFMIYDYNTVLEVFKYIISNYNNNYRYLK